MKRAIVLSAFIATNALALDFDTEWAKFKDDFARLVPKKTAPAETKALPPVEDAEVKQVDPKSPERLGLKLENQSMVNKLKDLYKRDDVVVYSTTVR